MNPSDLNIPGFGPQYNPNDSWDGKRSTVLDPRGNVLAEYYNGETPEIYIQGNTGRVYQGVPGTPEYDEMQRAHKKSTKRGIATVAALVGGGALGGALAGGAGAGGAGGGMGFTGAGSGGLSLGQVGQMAGRGALMRGFMPGERGGIPQVLSGGDGGLSVGVLGKLLPDSGTEWISLAKKGIGTLGAMRDQGSPPAPGGATGTPTTVPSSPMNRVRNPAQPDYFTYGKSGGEHRFFQDANSGDGATPPALGTAPGAIGALPSPAGWVPNHMLTGLPRRGQIARAGGGKTPTTGTGGRTDDIEALLSEGEYVMDAETVALLGDGSNEAGSARLDKLRENLRKHKGAALAKGKYTPNAKSPEEYIPGLQKGGRPNPQLGVKELPPTNSNSPAPLPGGRYADDDRSIRRISEMLEGLRESVGSQFSKEEADRLMKRTPKARGGYASQKQANLMRAVAHGWKPDQIEGPSRKVAEEFVEAKDRRAKGGKIPRLPREVTDARAPRSERQANLEMLRRLRQAIQKDKLPREGEDVGGDPYNRDASRVKKAHGGRVAEARARLAAINGLAAQHPVKLAKGGPAVVDMNQLADKLEEALKIGDPVQIDTAMTPVIEMAKGGRVAHPDAEVISAILEKYRPKRQTTPEDIQALADHLRKMNPQSPVLRSYDTAQKPKVYRPSEQQRRVK